MIERIIFIISIVFPVAIAVIEIVLAVSEKSKSRWRKAGSVAVIALGFSVFVLRIPNAVVLKNLDIYPRTNDLNPEKDMITFSKKTWGEIYYTLDGTDPEDGEKYTGPIKIETSDFPVTVMARQKFWWAWGNLVEAQYREARESDGANSDNSEGLLNAYNLNASSGFKLQTLKETLTIDSYVSNVKTESYETLPDGISCGWSDSEGGRESYTIEQINEGILGDKIIFNTIVIPDEDKHKYPDGNVSHEKNFVAARVDNGSYGSKNVWEGNLIEVAEGEQYMIRIYFHNNSLKGYDSVAEDVEAFFHVPEETGKTVVVHGFFQSSNASPTWYSDGVVLTSDRPFHLEYIPGSALLENNGIGSKGGQILDDKIVNESWTKIGYSALDGKIPGCYQYDSYLTIRVRPIFEKE